MKHVSVIIPNYNGRELLEKNLASVFEMMQDGNELVIADDNSTDDSWEWLIKKFGNENTTFTFKQKKLQILLIKNPQNLRFAANVNHAVEHSHHPLILLLNSDVAPHSDVLQHLLPYFNDPKVFAVGCLEQENHDGKIISGGKNTLWFQRGVFLHSRAKKFDSGETAWVSGGSGMFDKQKWQELGGFDKRFYPAYWEDIDLSFQAKKRGWKVLFESKAIVDHDHEVTNNDVFGQQKIEEMSWQNLRKFFQKNANFSQRVQNLLWKPYWLFRHHQVV